MGRDGLLHVMHGDSAMNGVDSMEAAADVLSCLNAFCGPGVPHLLSGRPWRVIDERRRITY